MISVCMATYNGERYLRAQIDSILRQLGEYDELVVSDDGSNDGTLSILGGYGDRRIRILHHARSPQRYGFGYAAKNFEHALGHARGAIVFLADQDDVWLAGKIERMVSELEVCDLVLSDCSYTDADLNILAPSKIEFDGVKIGAIRNLYKCGYLWKFPWRLGERFSNSHCRSRRTCRTIYGSG